LSLWTSIAAFLCGDLDGLAGWPWRRGGELAMTKTRLVRLEYTKHGTAAPLMDLSSCAPSYLFVFFTLFNAIVYIGNE